MTGIDGAPARRPLPRPAAAAARSTLRTFISEVLAPAEMGRSTTVNPLLWRIPAWAGLTVATVVSSHGTAVRATVGVLVAVGAVALQFISVSRPAVRAVALFVPTLAGMVACLVSSNSLPIVIVFVTCARAPSVFDHAALRVFVLLDAIATSVVIARATHSWWGLLSGIGVVFLVERSIEQNDLVRERDRVTALLVEARAAREAEAGAAALQERGRIAREMHDVLAHSLAGLSVQLQAVRTVAAREGVGPAVLEPLDQAATLAKDGLAEARAAVSTLRDPAGLGLDALPALIERYPATVSMTTNGIAGAVTPDAGHAVYRAVQESLTNAMRYAPGAEVTVSLDWRDDGLAVRVRDTGAAPGHRDVGVVSTGLGLAGMSERVAQVGGELVAGPAPSGGWLVRITVPLADPAS